LTGLAGKLFVKPGSRKGAWFAPDVMLSHDASGARILLHLPSGTYLRLDESAARIVDLLNEDPDPGHAAARLASDFDISHDQALGDVRTVIATVQGRAAARTHRGRLPTPSGMVAVGRSWRGLPRAGRWATAEAAMVIMVIEAGLAVSSLPRLATLMGVPLATDQEAAPVETDDSEAIAALGERERRAMWAVDWVLSRWLFDETCLRRSLAFGWFIRRRKPVLRLGMIDDGGAIAHAWVEAGGKAFDTTTVTGTFAVGTGPTAQDPPARAPGDPRSTVGQVDPGTNPAPKSNVPTANGNVPTEGGNA
jgi:hypothetical protein